MGRRRRSAGRKGELLAVVDLGSNAVRCLLAKVKPNRGYRLLIEDRAPTRLGDGPPGALRRAAIDDTMRAVHRFFAHRVPAGSGPRVVAVATSAVRDARNREQLLAPLRYREGVDVQVLSAREEARLGVAAALESLDFDDALVADLGGASLELSRVRARRVRGVQSLPLGAVRATRRFLRHDPPRPHELRALRSEVRAQLAAALPPTRRGDLLVAMGGTIRTLATMHLRAHQGKRKHRHGLHLSQADVTALRERLETVSPRKRRKIRGLKAERADIILAGAIVVEELMVFGGYLTLVVCTRGVRDGILLRETFDGRGRA
jgi:exopolyphosphatase / guanosine-5'-triphosphate,3'-diphosphate pyrophosphatase